MEGVDTGPVDLRIGAQRIQKCILGNSGGKDNVDLLLLGLQRFYLFRQDRLCIFAGKDAEDLIDGQIQLPVKVSFLE